MTAERITIIGSGRMGQGLGGALAGVGYDVTLIGRRQRPVPEGLALHVGEWAEVTKRADVILLATPDDVIETVAARLAEQDGVSSTQVVLHLSGLLDHSALDALRSTGAALGSFHPLKSVVEPEKSTGIGFARAAVGIEGDDRAVERAEAMATKLRMVPIRLPPGSKPAYHAAAVLVSNYTVALVDIAEQIAREAGLENVSGMFQRLLEGSAANLAALPPPEALTGPIRRGDAHTVEAHLAALAPADRAVYRVLGLHALDMAEGEGLDADVAGRIRAVLATEDPASPQ